MERVGDTPSTMYLIKQLEVAIRAHLDSVLRPHGLTTPQYTALSVLRRKPGMSSAQLARDAFVTPQSMNQLIIALQGRGLLTREADPHNRRILRTQLTADGERALRDCDAAVRELEELMVAGIGAEALATFRDVLLTSRRALAAVAPS